MNEAVQEFIEQQKQEEQKQRHLISLGLCDRVYAPVGAGFSPAYPECDYSTTPPRHYKLVAKSLTDEEYAAVCQWAQNSQPAQPELPAYTLVPLHSIENHSTVERVLKVFAIVLAVLGLIAGFLVRGDDTDLREPSWTFSLILWASTAVFCALLWGFAEIIRYLFELTAKHYRLMPVSRKDS